MTQRLPDRPPRRAADGSVAEAGEGGCDDSGWPMLDSLWADLGQLHPEEPARRRLREYIIRSCAPAARREAMRYRHAGEPLDDVVQVAMLGLVLAVDRFDARR